MRKNGYYNGVIPSNAIEDFMIQGGEFNWNWHGKSLVLKWLISEDRVFKRSIQLPKVVHYQWRMQVQTQRITILHCYCNKYSAQMLKQLKDDKAGLKKSL